MSGPSNPGTTIQEVTFNINDGNDVSIAPTVTFNAAIEVIFMGATEPVLEKNR